MKDQLEPIALAAALFAAILVVLLDVFLWRPL